MITATRAYACEDERRRAALREHTTLMGIDYLEVSADQHACRERHALWSHVQRNSRVRRTRLRR